MHQTHNIYITLMNGNTLKVPYFTVSQCFIWCFNIHKRTYCTVYWLFSAGNKLASVNQSEERWLWDCFLIGWLFLEFLGGWFIWGRAWSMSLLGCDIIKLQRPFVNVHAVYISLWTEHLDTFTVSVKNLDLFSNFIKSWKFPFLQYETFK